MIYSYTQISQYLTCPRRYRHRYLDGWKEKDTRAAMLFGRAFELALGALFRREDPGDVLFREWSLCQRSTVTVFAFRHLGSDAASKGSCSSLASARMTVSAYTSRAKIYRSNLRDLLAQERFRQLHRCHRETRRQALPAGMENVLEPVPRTAPRASCP